MPRILVLCSVILVATVLPLHAADYVRGTYVEARTCQIYTGPCFANGEVGSAGKNAVMTWQINHGSYAGVDISGKSVAVVVKASDTLGFKGLKDAKSTKAIVIIDSTADAQELAALKSFALSQTGIDDEDIAKVDQAKIELEFDQANLTAKVTVGDYAHLETRQARPGDCICSNESAYYPPLAQLKNFVPGVTLQGEVTARRLGTRWSIPDSRTAYMGTFEVESSNLQLAKSR